MPKPDQTCCNCEQTC